MGSFGERLRREREMRGISLEDIAGATKIGTRLLRALEEEHFDLLPGGIFNKGFVRAYAKYLGLNEDEAVAGYLLAAGDASVDPGLIAEQNDSRIDRSGSDADSSRTAGFPIIPVLILLIVIAAGLGGWRIYKDRMQQRRTKLDAAETTSSAAHPVDMTAVPSNPSTATSGVGQPTGASETPASDNLTGTGVPASTPAEQKAKGPAGSGATATTGNSPLSTVGGTSPDSIKPIAGGVANPPSTGKEVAAAADQPFEVTVRAVDNAWISIKSDGKIAVRGIIGPPDVKTVRATGQVIFWTGNAGAVEVSFNGQRIPLEGGPNTQGTLVFNSHGVVIPKPSTAARVP
jgi:cytoskeleton protein RodZ